MGGGLPLPLPSSREVQKLQNHRSFGTGVIFGVYPVCFPDASAEEVGRSERINLLRVTQIDLVPF